MLLVINNTKQVAGCCKQGYENSSGIKCWGSITFSRGTMLHEFSYLLR